MKESTDTGVIYKITNTANGKIYIGKAFSYEKHGKQPCTIFGGIGRLKRHLNNAVSENKHTSCQCPLLYDAMRTNGKECWTVETLLVCKKENLKSKETEYITKFQSYLPHIGYNIFIGDNKPISGQHKLDYEEKKVKSNRNRAKNSAMKRTRENKNLPANIYYRKSHLGDKTIEGYFVQNKWNS